MERIGERLYRLGLLLLPAELREAWADDLMLTFRARQRAVRRRSTVVALPLLWLRELAGVVAVAYRGRHPGPWARRTAPSRPAAGGTMTRTVGAWGLMDQLISDIRFSVRTFVRRPGMMGLAALSLALGIGASTAMFSVVDSVLLRPLPFEEPEALVSVYPSTPSLRDHPTFSEFAERGVFSLPEFWWVAENQSSFEAVGAYLYGGATLTGDGPPERLALFRVTPGLLPALGVSPLRGRLFTAEDDPREGGRAVLLTEEFWRTRFGSDPEVIGSTIRLNDEPQTVIGVLPATVSEVVPGRDVWRLTTGSSAEGNWANHNVGGAIGRLRDGVTIAQAEGEVGRIMASVSPQNAHDHGAFIEGRLADRTREVRPALLALLVGAFVLLAVGCGNAASILLGLGIDRERELAVRSALGAGRGRLTRQLLTESLVLAGVGAGMGVLLAAGVNRALVFLAPPGVPRIEHATVDGTALAFGIAVAALAGVLFGLVPALGLSKPELAESFKSARGTTGGRSLMQSAVVVAELALATVLLVSGALLGRTLFALNNVDLGLDADGLYAVRLALPYQRFDQEDPEARQAALDSYFQQLVDAAETVPGVASVAVTNNVPLTGDRSNNTVSPEGWDAEAEGEALIAERRFVSADYFQTTRVPIVEGRAFEAADNRFDAAPVMILSEGLARRVWPDEPAVGKQVSFWGLDPATVVGVAGDIRDEALERTTAYAFYAPARQVGAQTGSLLVRVDGDPGSVFGALRERIWAVDPDVPITRVVSFDELMADAVSQQRYRARLMIAFAALAALLAMMGVYGVVARNVARRTREMGIRVALGARRGEVRKLVLQQGLRLAAYGAIVGVALSLLVTGLLEELLFGVSRMDPLTLLGIAIGVGLVSVLASLPPSHRATSVDPVEALRE